MPHNRLFSESFRCLCLSRSWRSRSYRTHTYVGSNKKTFEARKTRPPMPVSMAGQHEQLSLCINLFKILPSIIDTHPPPLLLKKYQVLLSLSFTLHHSNMDLKHPNVCLWNERFLVVIWKQRKRAVFQTEQQHEKLRQSCVNCTCVCSLPILLRASLIIDPLLGGSIKTTNIHHKTTSNTETFARGGVRSTMKLFSLLQHKQACREKLRPPDTGGWLYETNH